MKMVITEKQFAKIIGTREEVLDEVDSALTDSSKSTTPSSSSSSSSSSDSTADSTPNTPANPDDPNPPYPDIPKWESGLERGAANQIDYNTKWKDIVYSKLSNKKFRSSGPC
jgi:hypothetical protein